MAAKKRRPLKLNLRRGALTRKAKKAGMSNSAYERKHARDKGRTGKQARLALAMKKWSHKRGKRKTTRTRKRTASRR
jgi:hypothetical protein